MIRLCSSGGKQPEANAVFVCDICGKPITKISDGLVVFRDHGVGGEELLGFMHVHKGNCDDKATSQASSGTRNLSRELADHLNELAISTGATIGSMIKKQVGVGAPLLTPVQQYELEYRVAELGVWLRECGISSPLWE